MKSLDQMFTPEEVRDFIDEQICRHRLGLRAKVERGDYTEEELAEDMKLQATLKALERMKELQSEIDSGLRDKDGFINQRV